MLGERTVWTGWKYVETTGTDAEDYSQGMDDRRGRERRGRAMVVEEK
jgi:hypothetical protein